MAVQSLEADARRSADTHLMKLPLPGPVDLYLKDESTHPTGSLKHRLDRSLFLYALCNGWIGPTTTVVEASSGSTAVSEAYFARLIGVPFVAVMSRATSPAKIALIKREGGRCHLIDDPAGVYDVAARLAHELNGHYLDQFTYAERATDWRGNNNIAEATLAQMALEPHRIPILDRRRCRNRRHRGGVCSAWESPLVLQPAPTSSVHCPACETHADQTAGTIVTLMCDSGARYTTTYDDDIWLKEQGIDISPYLPVVERAWEDKVCDGAYSVRRRVSALCFCTVLARSQSAGGRLMRARSPRRRRRWYSAKSASIMIDTDVHLDEYANPAGRKPVGMGRQARVNTASATTW